jgi:4,5-dihydroxyphthalate decarboxylase
VAKVRLSLAFSRSARSAPLLDGEVTVEGVDLIPCLVSPGDLFWRQLHHAEFDSSEFSIGSLVIRRSQGDDTWRAIPVFPSRAFFHTQILVRRGVGIRRPEDLRGKRVGIPEYQQTAGLWTRGALLHEFGVRPEEIEWVMGRTADRSHGGATGFEPPDGVRLTYPSAGETLGSLIADGRLDALIAYGARTGGLGLGQEPLEWQQQWSGRAGAIVGGERVEGALKDRVSRLFRDPRREGKRYFDATGIFPMNHTVILRRSLAEKYPWLPRNLYEAFCAARELAVRRMLVQLEPYEAIGALRVSDVAAGEEIFPYGVSANKVALGAALTYAHEQGLVSSPVALDDIFFDTTLEW